MSDFPEIRPLTLTSGITECLSRASAMVNAFWHLSCSSQQPHAVVPIITHTLQVSEILGDLPVGSWDFNPGHLTVAPTHLTIPLDLTLLTPNPVLRALFLAAQQPEEPAGAPGIF